MSTYFERAKSKAGSDRHWKQVETGLMTAGAAAAVFLVKTAVEHLTTRQTASSSSSKKTNSPIDRLMRGF